MHIMETVVDFRECTVVRNVLINLDLSGEVVYEFLQSGFYDKKARNEPFTRIGSSVLPLTPPKAVPRHVRPVTSWNLDVYVNICEDAKSLGFTYGRVEIS